MKKKRMFKTLMLVAAIVLFVYLQYGREMEVYTSFTVNSENNQYKYLNVIVNKLFIFDSKSCAEKIVQKCRENSFKNRIFSYDQSIPNGLAVTVFLSEWHFRRQDPSFSFRYAPIDADSYGEYNIVDHPDQFCIIF